MNVFRSIIDIGTKGQNEVTDKKHIRFANSISLIICFFIVQNIAISLVYTQYLIAVVQSLHFIFIALVLYWNYKGRRVLASAWFSSSAIFFVTIYAIIFTLESLNFTFLMMIILLQVFLFSPSEKKYIIVFIAMTVLCFAAVLVVAGLYPSVGERIPEGLINAQRWNTIVGLPMLSTLMAIYVLFTISKTEEEAAKKKASLEIAQRQLIQSEKMASLGELTAGIAHEIQNPLNFVNNFSEVSGELIDDVQQEIEKGDLEETSAILQDLKENLSKINHHGKRAGSIVKGMLEHSRKSQGKKELTDLNLLADECLRFSFHGLRAKDKSFTADFDTLDLLQKTGQNF